MNEHRTIRPPSTRGGQVPQTAAEFETVLDQLMIVWQRGHEPSIGPVSARTDRVIEWLEYVLDDNPALVIALQKRFAGSIEVIPDVRVLPVATLKAELLMTLQHGNYVDLAG